MITRFLRISLGALILALLVPITQVSAQDKNIVEAAAEQEQLMTFIRAAKKAGLVGKLMKGGPYTLFIPSNAAFDKMPKYAWRLFTDGRHNGMLRTLLRYHIVEGKHTIDDLKGGAKRLKTQQGGKLRIKTDGDVLKVDGASISGGSIVGSNGIVHVLDTVVLPRRFRGSF